MEKVYAFTYINREDKTISSEVIADNEGHAYERLGDMGISPYELKLNLGKTISLSKKLPLRQLGRFYETMGKRIENGSSIVKGLESAIEFTNDTRLKASISTLYNAMSEGRSMGVGMQMAQFPERHAKSISAMEDSGQTDVTLKSLAEECYRDFTMQSSIKKLLRMPKVFAVLVICMFYGAFGFLSPMMLGKMIEIVGEGDLSSYTEHYYYFVKAFSDNIVISTIIYFGFFIGIYAFGRTALAARLVDKIKIIHQISERGDMAGLWLRYGLMFQAAINPQQSALMVGRSAKRTDSKECFRVMESFLQSGYTIPVSVERAEFPDYVISSIRAGASAEDMGTVMISMSQELFEDVDMLISQLTDTLQTLITLAMSVSVLLFFALTYYPLLSTLMSQV